MTYKKTFFKDVKVGQCFRGQVNKGRDMDSFMIYNKETKSIGRISEVVGYPSRHLGHTQAFSPNETVFVSIE